MNHITFLQQDRLHIMNGWVGGHYLQFRFRLFFGKQFVETDALSLGEGWDVETDKEICEFVQEKLGEDFFEREGIDENFLWQEFNSFCNKVIISANDDLCRKDGQVFHIARVLETH